MTKDGLLFYHGSPVWNFFVFFFSELVSFELRRTRHAKHHGTTVLGFEFVISYFFRPPRLTTTTTAAVSVLCLFCYCYHDRFITVLLSALDGQRTATRRALSSLVNLNSI